jgi:hypothetical protein
MKTLMSLWCVIMQADGSAGTTLREPMPGAGGVRAKLGILVLALLLCSLGAAALVLAAHGSAGHAHMSALPRPWIY